MEAGKGPEYCSNEVNDACLLLTTLERLNRRNLLSLSGNRYTT